MSIPGTARGNLIGEKLPHACMLMELIEVTYYINGLQLFYDNERSSKNDQCFLLVEMHPQFVSKSTYRCITTHNTVKTH